MIHGATLNCAADTIITCTGRGDLVLNSKVARRDRGAHAVTGVGPRLGLVLVGRVANGRCAADTIRCGGWGCGLVLRWVVAVGEALTRAIAKYNRN